MYLLDIEKLELIAIDSTGKFDYLIDLSCGNVLLSKSSEAGLYMYDADSKTIVKLYDAGTRYDKVKELDNGDILIKSSAGSNYQVFIYSMENKTFSLYELSVSV